MGKPASHGPWYGSGLRWDRIIVAWGLASSAIAFLQSCALFAAAGCPSPAASEDASIVDASGEGAVSVNATFSTGICATVDPLSIGPNNGGTVVLSATIVGSDQVSGMETLLWTATSGAFSDPNSPTTSFTCTAAGTVTVTFTVSSSGGCSQQAIGTVVCD